MYLKFGNYTHLINNAGVSIDSVPLTDARGEIYAHEERWTVDFRIPNTTTDPKTLDPLVTQLQAAYAQDTQELPTFSTMTLLKLSTSSIVLTSRAVFASLSRRLTFGIRMARWSPTGVAVLSSLALSSGRSPRLRLLTSMRALTSLRLGAKYEALTPNVGDSIIQRTATVSIDLHPERHDNLFRNLRASSASCVQ